MGNEHLDRTLHSAEYFGDSRDFWWSRDFLELMARRWKLRDVHRALDVGSGVGHWGRLLQPFLAAGARVKGIDREAAWVEEGARRAAVAGLSNFEYLQASADHLPFDDDTFDMVTCQTVLIHVPDLGAALREMVRVLRPGGLLAVAEPNTLSQAFTFSDLDFEAPIAHVTDRVRFFLTCQRGKQAVGGGNDMRGELLPRAFHDAGLDDIQVCLNDVAAFLIPPYASARQQADVREEIDFAGRDFWIWSRDDTRRYFLAGGGTDAEFDVGWQAVMDEQRRRAQALREGTLTQAGGSLFYLVWGRKPA